MNTSQLKKFAQEARLKLIQQVGAKLSFVLTSDSPELREKAEQVNQLREELTKTTKEQLIEKVAYTWFNRLMALRFMDANDYQPLGIRVITPKDGYTTPELLDEAKRGNIPDELKVNRERVMDILDGRIPSSNSQNEAFKELLIAACNHLYTSFPFLFEKISDYSELLLPDDLTSDFSIVNDVCNGMPTDDCKNVEIIGWLYQFYISEKKDEVFASKSAVKKEDIPAATQLFTPRWIVEYMVQNTVGKLWLQNRPKSRLREHMPYFIESPSLNADDYLKIKSPEEIKLLDPASGSGHILVYSFDLFTKIYEEEGYNTSDIPKLIIEKNLNGFEIDERAAQLSALALMMKAREYQRRALKKDIKPNILCYKDLEYNTDEITNLFDSLQITVSDELLLDLTNMQQATNFGSLIIPKANITELHEVAEKLHQLKSNNDLFQKNIIEGLLTAIDQLIKLSPKFHCVAANPPYMGGGNMNKELSQFVKTNYPDSKADLMACFMELGLAMLVPNGFMGMINQHSWMFLSSYEKLRTKLIQNTFFDTLLHLGARTFPEIGGEVVQNAAFTFWNTTVEDKGSYIRLVDFKKSELKRTKTIEAIRNSSCEWFYVASQINFKKIPGSPIGYWTTNKFVSLFVENELADKYLWADGKNVTSDSSRFLRFNWEIENIKRRNSINSSDDDFKWVNLSKGGTFRRWYGNLSSVINWSKEARVYYRKYSIARIIPENQWYQEGISWTKISSNRLTAFRYFPEGGTFDDSGLTVFFDDDNKKYKWYFLGILNSRIFENVNEILNQTLNLLLKDVRTLPIVFCSKEKLQSISKIVQDCVEIAKTDWSKYEEGWDFIVDEFIRIEGQDLEESYDLYQQYWRNKFFQLHKNEEELNRQFIEIYGLQDELTPDVKLEDITILKEETSIKNGELHFNAKEVFAQFISYAVGCMFGRYSLDKEGLILANQGETLEDYHRIIGKGVNNALPQTSPLQGGLEGGVRNNEQSPKSALNQKSPLGDLGVFMPDDDNIIPILDNEWFEDDIVARFHTFLKVAFGEKDFSKNIAFIEEKLGKDIRKYFIKDFYTDHIKRYKKRPIYWMFSSPKGSFNALIYMHRYTPDTVSNILNKYLKEYMGKLNTRKEHLQHILVSGSAAEITKAIKETASIEKMLIELHEYERDILYPLATERIAIDLDDGVLVNYNKFGNAIKPVAGLNDKVTKKKVKEFDWIDTTQIK